MGSKLVEPILLLVDMDGVIVDFAKGFRAGYAKLYDEPDPGELTCFEVFDAYPHIEQGKLWDVWHQKGFFLGLDPMPGALEALEAMARCDVDIYFCSSPSAISSWSEKAEWIEHWLGDAWTRKLILTKDKTLVIGDYLLDDKPIITGSSIPTWEHVVFNGQYNKDIDPKDERLHMDWTDWPRLLRYHGSKR
jgi:5'-nucleotidase